MKIPLLNLKRQYKRIEKEVLGAIVPLLASGCYIMGQEVKGLEEEIAEYVGTRYAISCGNGTDALILSLTALGIGQGHEVITTPFTFFATVEAIVKVGARPVFVDIDDRTYNMDVNKIEAAISHKTKAIMPVHIFGQSVRMDEVNRLAKKHNLYVIEDACQAIGATYQGEKVGSLSDIGCFSFFPTKNLGGYGDGGMITTNNESVYKIIRGLRCHGSGLAGLTAYNEINKENLFEALFECPTKYYNYLIGCNSRLDALQAGILRVKLKYLEDWNKQRDQVARYYNAHISVPNLVTPRVLEGGRAVSHLYVLQHKERDQMIKHLNKAGIETGIYYPIPLHLQTALAYLGYKEGDLPVAEYIARRVLAIPAGPELYPEERQYIVETINQYKES